MDSQEAQIITDAVELGMIMLNDWSIANNYRGVEDLSLVYISAVGTYISKLKPLVENMKN